MHVLGRFHELGETGQGVARLRVPGTGHLCEDRAVSLDDEGPLVIPGRCRFPFGMCFRVFRHGN